MMLKRPFQLFFVVALFLFLKSFYFLNYHFVLWDEAVYIGMGKYLWSSGRVGLWEPLRHLGLPMLLGLIWKLNLNLVFFSQLLELLFAVGNIVVVYLLGKKMFNVKVGFVAAFLLAFTPVFFRFSSDIVTEIPSTFFALLSFYFFISKKYSLSGLFAGLSFLFRFQQLLLLFSLPLLLLIENRKSRQLLLKKTLSFVIPFVMVCLPFFTLNYFLYHNAVGTLRSILFPLISAFPHQSNLAEAVSNRFQNLVFYPANLLFQSPLLILSLIGIFKPPARERYPSRIIIVLLVYLAYLTFIISKQFRYSLLFLPFICLLAAYGLFEAVKYIERRSRFAKLTLMALLFLSLTLGFLVVYKENKLDYASHSIYIPEVVEFYKYFSEHPVDGYILTTDPNPVTFTDALFVPMYDNPEEALRVYNSYKANASAIIYTTHFYPCEYYGQECEQQKQQLFAMIQNDFNLTINRTYFDQQYYVFTK